MIAIRYTYPNNTNSDAKSLYIDSEAFPNQVRYQAKGGSIIIYTEGNGILAVDRHSIRRLAIELLGVAEVWEDIPT